jgi:endonuclease/exonuclease/phosphatase (EEP) superfamily protein YafD
MRIIFFNVWHGQVWDGLKKFILDQSKKTDIFCFLEADPSLQSKLTSILPDFTPIYDKGIKTAYVNGIFEGRSIFVRNGIDIGETQAFSLFKVNKRDAGGFQYAKLRVNGKELLIGEVHGKARPGTKKDTPTRLNQSKKIIDFFADKKGPKIIGGDFNLDLNTKSVAMFEGAGYRNLIKDFGIKNTRNRLSWEIFNNVQYFADYCFVSPEVKVKNFEVPQLEISDHQPLILDFEI